MRIVLLVCVGAVHKLCYAEGGRGGGGGLGKRYHWIFLLFKYKK